MPHHRAQDFRGQFQVLAIEGTANGRRILRKVHKRVQQRVVAMYIRTQAGLNHRPPLLGGEDHAVRMQLVGERVDRYLNGVLPSKRWPRVTLPDRTPAISKGTTSSCSKATIQRMGRINRGPPLPVQYIVFGK